MRNIALMLLLVAGALAPATAVGAQMGTPSPGRVELQLLEAPTARRDDPRARIYIIDHLNPGASISRKIGIVNRSPSSVRVALYAGAANVGAGTFVPLEGRGGNDVASWTHVEPSAIDVPPSGRAEATASIDVPRDATAGERYGVVWAELPKAGAPGGGAAQINRVGIRIYLSVGPGGEPRSDFSIDSLQAARTEHDQPVVTALVHNTGFRALDMSGSMVLANGPGGLRAGPFAAQLGVTLGIDLTAPVTVPLDAHIPDGPWDATITLKSGVIERTVSGKITFPHAVGKAPPATVNPATSARRWWTVLGAVGAILLLSGLLVAFLRRRRRRKT